MRIVIPDDNFELFTGTPALDLLRGLGEVRHYRDNAPDREALLERVGDAEIILTTRYQTDFKTTDLLEHIPGLKMIAVMGTRPRRIDMKRARGKGITVSCTPGASSPSIAEHTIMMVLALAKRLPAIVPAMREGGWPRADGIEIEGKTISLLGFGHIGAKVSRKAVGLGMRVIAWSRSMTPERAAGHGAEAASLDACLGADFVSLHLHVTDETRGIMSRETIAKMKPHAFLINTSRAALVDMEALIDALRESRIAGAGIDVFEPEEPLPEDSPYRSLDNVILTPHSAWNTDGTVGRFLTMPVENIEAFLKGAPQNVVTEDV
jgi:phosphoglycerate dehydrogenase-like enzyme